MIQEAFTAEQVGRLSISDILKRADPFRHSIEDVFRHAMRKGRNFMSTNDHLTLSYLLQKEGDGVNAKFIVNEITGILNYAIPFQVAKSTAIDYFTRS